MENLSPLVTYLYIFSHKKHKTDAENVPVIEVVKTIIKFLIPVHHVAFIARLVVCSDI